MKFICSKLHAGSLSGALRVTGWAWRSGLRDAWRGAVVSAHTHTLLPSFPFVFSSKNPGLSSFTGSETGLGGEEERKVCRRSLPTPGKTTLRDRPLFPHWEMPLAFFTAQLEQPRSCWGSLLRASMEMVSTC